MEQSNSSADDMFVHSWEAQTNRISDLHEWCKYHFTKKQRTVLIMHFCDGYTLDEIANHFARTENLKPLTGERYRQICAHALNQLYRQMKLYYQDTGLTVGRKSNFDPLPGSFLIGGKDVDVANLLRKVLSD